MTEQNQNFISPFLVKNSIQQVREGAEKALHIQVIAALFPKACIFFLL